MILSVSRRTDIPAFYTDWFFKRLHEGYVLVRNPMNYHQVSRIILTPKVIDCIVFWTKDPTNILKKLDLLSEYKYYFQITINAYGKEIERNVPPKGVIIEAFKNLSNKIGKDKNQRDICGCVASIDIGAYNTCQHGCIYCYANYSDKAIENNLLKHSPNSPMLVGNIEPDDKITDRKMESYINKQMDLFSL